MLKEYLRAFVIGSCCFVFLPYFYVVSNMKEEKRNYSYKYYSYLAPIFFGLMNVLSLFLAMQFKLSKRIRFLLISILAPTFISLFITFFKLYNYDLIEKWIEHIIKLYIFYFIVWNLIVFNLDKYV
jgi:hypothetical protein